MLALIVIALAGPAAVCETVSLPARDCSLREYQAHLVQLQELTGSCKESLLKPGQADLCKSESVGPDDMVALQSGRRLIDYEWLRATIDDAAALSTKTDSEQAIPEGPSPHEAAPDTHDAKQEIAELEAAGQRLQRDLAQAASLNESEKRDQLSESVSVRPSPASATATLKAVLAASEFHRVTSPSPFERAMQRAFEWLDRKLMAMGNKGAPSRTLVRLIVFSSILVCLTLLAWWYVRALKRQRVAGAASPFQPHPQAASAVDWRDRMQQAQALAAIGEWRQAVHHVYWAAISRLEARGNWPADRSRTPREYLLLLPSTHGKKADLLLLTRSFERIWYGHLNADQQDFDDARTLLERIGSE